MLTRIVSQTSIGFTITINALKLQLIFEIICTWILREHEQYNLQKIISYDELINA